MKNRAGKDISLRGVKPTMETLYYPSYSYRNARKPTKTGLVIPKSTHQFDINADRKPGPRTSRGGMRQGSTVDRQLGQVANMIRTGYPDVSVSFFVDKSKRLPVTMSVSQRTKVYNFRRRLHPYTVNVLRCFKCRGWVPVHTQVCVGSLAHRVGTAIDVVCVYANPRRGSGFIVIELKCGFDSYYYNDTGASMARPFGTMTDACVYQHQLQLLTSTWLFEGCPSTIRSEAYVVRAHKNGVTFYTLPLTLRGPRVTKALSKKLASTRSLPSGQRTYKS